ncbi:MAG TPA: beta-ketoacyl-ACP synthase III [Candidatus Limnocylindrales bacterium]|nr:beta-ketoacyl-ACP synthase III [Candidatus Limnocylindrales bacterium]
MELPRSVRITGWGMYAPERVLTNADLEKLVDTSDEWIRTRTGIRERRVAAPHETTATLAAVAGKRAIAVAGLEPDEIDLILVATLTPDYWMPATAVLVKEAIGNRRAVAFDVMAACSGFVYAYATADAYIRSGMYRNALVIGAEVLTRFLDYSDRSTCILFGDGAGAVVVSASDEPGGGMAGLELTTDPDGAYMIWLPSGGSKSPPAPETFQRGEHYVRMEGKETYRYATKTLASSALTAIERAGWQPDEVDLFIPHQANIRIIEAVAKGLGLPMEKMFVNVDRYGNTSAASVGLALAEAVDSGRVKVGDKVVFVAFGAGFTSGAAAVEWTADPAHGKRAESVVPVASVRAPVDWDSVDPMPPRLLEVLASGPPVPLDDVVPGEPEPASHPVR